MKKLRTVPIACLTVIVALAVPAPGQQTPTPAVSGAEANTRVDPASEARSEYEFVIGDWDVAVTLRRAPEPDLNYKAKWHNYWLVEGRLLMQEWEGPYARGFELRSYSGKDRKWHGRNIYLPDPGDWYDNTAERVGGEMIVTTRRPTPDGGESVTREIYHDLDSDHFSIRSELLSDDGRTWRPGRYRATMTRVRPGIPAVPRLRGR